MSIYLKKEEGKTKKDAEVSCLRFPPDVEWLLRAVPSHKFTSLPEVFRDLIRTSEYDLLDQPAKPEQCQFRMTMYMIKRQHDLLEEAQSNHEMASAVITAAERCPDFNWKGMRRTNGD